MSNVSANVLFHFTGSLKNLESIIVNGFKVGYSLEDIAMGTNRAKYAFPMVCLCDLPLKLAKNHIEEYGEYAIGLKKSWALKNKFNPVIYLENNSKLAEHLAEMQTMVEFYLKARARQNENDVQVLHPQIQASENMMYNFLNILRFMKNYNNQDGSYRYYDEREWRYVPDPSPNNKKYPFRLTESKYNELRAKSDTKPFAEGVNLKFNGDDIECIIVKNSAQIPKVINWIKTVKDLTRSPAEADILTTKIFTIERLNSYF